MQAAQLIKEQGTQGLALGLGHVSGKRSRQSSIQHGLRVGLRLQHHGAHHIFDKGAMRQAQRIGLRQGLADGHILLRAALIGPNEQVAQQLYPPHFINTQHGLCIHIGRHIHKRQRAQVGAKQRCIGRQARGANGSVRALAITWSSSSSSSCGVLMARYTLRPMSAACWRTQPSSAGLGSRFSASAACRFISG